MAFRIRPKETVAHGLRRLARKELRAARTHLLRATPPGDESIHEARKSLKKIRAVLALVGRDDDQLDGCPRRIRKVNRVLSRLRDADAMLKVLMELRSRNPELLSEHAFARVRRRLLVRKREARERASGDRAWNRVDRHLRDVARTAKRWRPAKRGFGAIARGIKRIHRAGRKAMARAKARQTAADFHEWRKQIKALWYALRLVEHARGVVARHISALHHAETCLGEDHNVVVLCSALADDRSICEGGVDVDRVRVSGHEYQCEMRTQAIAAARQIYRRKPADYVRAIERAWELSRRPRRASRSRRRAAA